MKNAKRDHAIIIILINIPHITDLYEKVAAGLESSCGSFLYVATGLGALLVLSAFIMCYLASRLHSVSSTIRQNKTIDELVRDRSRKYCDTTPGYTGRSTMQ
jgi:hypothetical protein